MIKTLKILASISVGILMMGKTNAQPRSVGASFSYAGQGLVYEHSIDRTSFAEIQLRSETASYFRDRKFKPGISASFTWNMIFAQKTLDGGNCVRFFAGPGAAVGFADDFHNGKGIIFGMKGRLGGECSFSRNITLSASISPVLGVHLDSRRGMMNMLLYENGLLQSAMPEISIKYSIGGNPSRGEGGNDATLPSGFTYGIEFGYVAAVGTAYHHNFYAPDGFRTNDYGLSFRYFSNEEVYAHAGYMLNPYWNLSMYIGYESIFNYHKALPVSLRMTRFFRSGSRGDRWLSFIDLGSGISIKRPPQEIFTGKLGGGYRLKLSDRAAIDFLISARMTYTHSQIVYDKTVIPIEDINMNNTLIGSLSIGIGISFN